MQNFVTVNVRESGNIILNNTPPSQPELTPQRIADNKKFVEDCARERSSSGGNIVYRAA